jgi:hypothetical protein
MSRRTALLLVLAPGLAAGALGAAVGHAGLWALVLLASLLAGLAEVGSG